MPKRELVLRVTVAVLAVYREASAAAAAAAAASAAVGIIVGNNSHDGSGAAVENAAFCFFAAV